MSLIEQCNVIDKIDQNLYLGGLPKEITQFSTVICVTEMPRYWVNAGQRLFVFPYHDSVELPCTDFLDEVSDLVVKYCQRGPTLVHCTAGLNRSSLIMGLALVKMGRTPEEALELMRSKRSRSVLGNKTFKEWFLRYERRS